MSKQPPLSEGSTVEMPPRDSSSQVRIALLADTAQPKKPSASSRHRQMSTTSGQNQEFVDLYRIDEAKSANSVMKWQQTEEERERKAAAVGQAYSDIAPTSTSASASAAAVNKNVFSMSSSSIMAHDVLGKLRDLRLHLLADIPNTSSGLILASSSIIVAIIFIFAALIHKLKARRRTKNAKVGPSGPDIIKRRNSNEPCSSNSECIYHSLTLQPLENSTSHQHTTGLVRKSSRRRSSSAESSPPNAAFASCHQRDTAFAKDRRADTLVNAMPPDMGGKYKQRIFFARRHSLTQSTCRVLDAALSAESKDVLASGSGGEEEELSMSSSAFDLDV